ncbi:MAG TPA: hypothetical protein VG712_04430, partial [Gemmatimonadales bacterium]|nr:hypothetical protein [Gemmatimonadales bacterium]
MHLSRLLLPAALLAAPLSAQTATPASTLTSGTAVRVQWRGDTAWHEVEVAWIDGPTGKCPGAKLPPPEPGDDGFMLRSFSGATAIAVRDAGGSWAELPATELREIQGCRTGQVPAPDVGCGTAPQVAKMSVAGAIYGGRMNPGSGGPWDEFISLQNA